MVTKVEVRYEFSESNTALDGPRINQSNDELESSYTTIPSTLYVICAKFQSILILISDYTDLMIYSVDIQYL